VFPNTDILRLTNQMRSSALHVVSLVYAKQADMSQTRAPLPNKLRVPSSELDHAIAP